MLTVAQGINNTISESKNLLQQVGDEAQSIFEFGSVMRFIVLMLTALILGRIVASLLRKLTKAISNRADKIEDLNAVTRLRRMETLIVLSIAAIRVIFVLFAFYLWWTLSHGSEGSTALLGAGAIITLVLSAALNPLLRDVATGSVMMAEHWYGVGDHIHIEPFPDAQGVVERVTLRSTKIRKFSGEILWINNKDIAGVSVTPKGVRSVVIELFAKDLEKGVRLVEDANLRLPRGPLAVASPLTVMTTSAIGSKLWHITAISEVAPGREWLLDKFALEILQELDEHQKTLAHDPIARYADSEAERRFARTIKNARKPRIQREGMVDRVEKAARRGANALTHEKSEKTDKGSKSPVRKPGA